MNELLHRKLLGPQSRQCLGFGTGEGFSRRQQASQGVAQGLATHAEGGLHHRAEEHGVAAQVGDAVAGEAHDAGLDLWRRVEDFLADGEEVFDVVPCLQEHAQYAAGLGAGGGGEPFGHLALEHAGAAHDAVLEIEDAEENLRRDVVGVVANDAELRHLGGREKPVDVHAQEVALDDAVRLKRGHVSAQVFHRLAVYLDHGDIVAVLEQKLCEHAHAGTNLKHRQTLVRVKGSGYAPRHRHVGQKMLSQCLLGFHLCHDSTY